MGEEAVSRDINTIITSEEERLRMSRTAAAQGMVLLENDGVLPLKKGQKIALFGTGAKRTLHGTTPLKHYRNVSVEEGLLNAGFQINTDAWSEERDPELDTAIIVFSRLPEAGRDRQTVRGDYFLSDAELTLLHQVTDDYPHVIVVLNMSNVIDLSFLDDCPVSALVLMGLAGPEGGNALADILSGDVNPCGRLTDTWAMQYQDYPVSDTFSRNNGNIYEERYSEGIYVGYRYFDTFGIRPRYPFGYGLSYTTFAYRAQHVRYRDGMVTIELSVKNTGTMAGAEVLQFYVSKPWGLRRNELKQLVGFRKTQVLRPNEEVTIVIEAPIYGLATWHTGKAQYYYDKGDYIALAGSSAQDVQPVGILHLPKRLWMEPLKSICPLQDALKELVPPEHSYRMQRAEWMKQAEHVPHTEINSAQMIRHVEDSWELIDWDDLSGDEMQSAPFALRRMSLNEKIRTVIGEESLKQTPDFQTADELFPCGTHLAQTFDTHLLMQVGETVGELMKAEGVRLYLAPLINLHRDPLGGSNTQAFSEDPLVSGQCAAALADGVQRHRELGLVLRHFACSNQAENEKGLSAIISERALREIYLKSFEICIREAQPKALMTAYHKINGVHCANSSDLCTEITRNEWGFEGIILTDWGATNKGAGCSAARCIAAGVDMVMPGGFSDTIELKEALEGNGDYVLHEDQLDICALRALTFLLTR